MKLALQGELIRESEHHTLCSPPWLIAPEGAGEEGSAGGREAKAAEGAGGREGSQGGGEEEAAGGHEKEEGGAEAGGAAAAGDGEAAASAGGEKAEGAACPSEVVAGQWFAKTFFAVIDHQFGLQNI